MIKVEKLIYRISGKTLLDEVSLSVPLGHKAAIVGRNGCGKSTLFKIMLGELHADSGFVEVSKGLKVITVAQDVPGGETTPLEHLLKSDHERDRLMRALDHGANPNEMGDIYDRLLQIDAYGAESRAAIVLKGLGFPDEDHHKPLSSFSGGYRMRVALGAALYQFPDILLLDEPTNHLDMESLLWLRSFLRDYPNTLLLISHDRDLLNTCVETVFHVQQGKITRYSGNYDFFEKTSQQQRAFQAAYNAKLLAQKEHMQAFVDRFRASAAKARQAQSRMKAIAKLGPVTSVVDDPSIAMTFPEMDALSPPIISFENIALGYDDHVVLEKLNGSIQPDDRIALLGANGNGKSTFAQFLAGRLKPMKGKSITSPKLRIGYFHQHQHEDLDMTITPYYYLRRLMPQALEPKIRGHLGRFGFSRDKADIPIQNLSGGEKVRLMFSAISVGAPHLLILDEPTNHLDMDMRESLMLALNDFEGAVILIAHDWHLLEHTVDQLWVVGNKSVTPFDGSLEDYKQRLLGGPVKQDKSKLDKKKRS